MRTIKLVIIGDSGVGKTSFRSQYILGRFSTGYRATIGTDFITKTLPHYKDPSDSVTLQIWDTAGQERFSSLSSAFFRGADAALLMFDVNRPETLAGLTRWWAEFRACAPVLDADARDYCVVVVGNKVDLDPDRGADVHMGLGAEGGGGVAGLEGPLLLLQAKSHPRVSEAEAERFLEELVPPQVEVSSDEDECSVLDEDADADADTDDPFVVREGEGGNEHTNARTSAFFLRPSISGFSLHSVYRRRRASTNAEDFDINGDCGSEPESPQRPRTQSISIQRSGSGRLAPPNPGSLRVSKSHTSDRSQLVGTMSTMRTTHTLYHTPASSLFGTDAFESAPSSPLRSRSHSYDGSYNDPGPWGGSASPLALATTPGGRAPRRMTSSSSTSSVPTITPSLFMRAQASASPSAAPTPPTPVEAHGDAAHFSFSRSAPAPPISQSTSTSAQFTSVHGDGRTRRRVHLPPRPERGPRLFFTSAKTGAGVAPVFEYIAQRVAMRCEYVEAREALTGGPRHDDTLRLTDARSTAGSSSSSGGFGWVRVPGGVTCCGS